jgi:CPA1 family monovalent cation:H+ antiporter
LFSLFDLISLLLTLSALFAWLNHRLIGLPSTIGIMVMGLAASLTLIVIDILTPQVPIHDAVTAAMKQLDFADAVLNGMLAFLLFAGALQVDFASLRSRALAIGTMATLGVLLSTLLVGGGVWLLAGLFGIAIPLPWALVFGALISPTDPVAVLATLKETRLPKAIEGEASGEALFNDGVGVVLFILLVSLASGYGTADFSAAKAIELFLVEAVGGIAFGAVTGYIAYRAMKALDDYPIEVLISVALVTGTYALANKIGVSGPLAVVAAGLLIGERGPGHAMSEKTQRYLFAFWTLIDEMLNAVLFLMIGLEVLVVGIDGAHLLLALAVIPIVLVARFCAVAGPVTLLKPLMQFSRGTIPILAWAGVRGGISIALALSLPESDSKPALLSATYAVVLFTLVVQGLTLPWAVRRFTTR